jgi:hypothetical protein
MLVVVTITLCITVLVCLLIALAIKKAVELSKITFALFIALVLNNSNPILEGRGFISYLIWAAILIGGLFLLCMIPRLNCALEFFCSTVVSYFFSEMVLNVCLSIWYAILGKTYEQLLIVEILVKVICIGISCRALFSAIALTPLNLFENPILVNLERVVASVIYGLAIFIVIVSGTYTFPAVVEYIILAVAIVTSFLIDFAFTKY